MRYVLSAALASLISLSTLTSSFANSPLICVTQIVTHPALDKTQRGIIDELAAQGFQDPDTATIQIDTAQGQPALATQIAQKCVGQKAAIIVALGTSMAQACAKATVEEKIPVVFSSVTDPEGAKLVKDLKTPEVNITGASNFTPLEDQLNLFLELVPNLKTLGVILNPGEANSLEIYKRLEKIAKEKGVTLLQGAAFKSSDVGQAAKSLVGKVDALFVSNDNTALSAFEAIVSVSQQYKVPLFVSDADIVEKGALAALGPDQYVLGRQTGAMVARLLKGESVSANPVEYPKDKELILNQKAADLLGVSFSQDLLKKATQVIK
jgi:putative ABC transport system substrate-binding protein